MMIQALILILITIESGGDNAAIGDNGQAVGCLQIHPIMVREVNRILGRKVYTLKDRYSRRRSIEMATVFLTRQRNTYFKSFQKYPDYQTLGSGWNTGSIRKQNQKYRLKIKVQKAILDRYS